MRVKHVLVSWYKQSSTGKKSGLSWAKTQCVAPYTTGAGCSIAWLNTWRCQMAASKHIQLSIQTPARGEAHRLIESVAEGLRQRTYLGSG